MRLTGIQVGAMLTKAVVIALVGAAEASAQTADVAGTWIITITNQATGVASLAGMPVMLEQDGRTLTGGFVSENEGRSVLSGSVNGSEISFTFVLDVAGEPIDAIFMGNIGENGVITGTAEVGGGLMTGTFTAVRSSGAVDQAAPRATRSDPVFTPMTVRPEIRNRSEVQEALVRLYPRDLRSARIGGQVLVWFFISDEGRVLDKRVARTSGHEELDAAALEVADVFRFAPALNGGERIQVWIQMPITFQVTPRRE